MAQPWPACEQIVNAAMSVGSLGLGVVEHDQRRLAAELEEHLLHRGAGRLHDLAADRGRAGEADHVDVGVGGEDLADRDVGGGEDVDDAGRDVGLVGDDLAERGASSGVCGAPFRTTVQPAASAGASFASESCIG